METWSSQSQSSSISGQTAGQLRASQTRHFLSLPGIFYVSDQEARREERVDIQGVPEETFFYESSMKAAIGTGRGSFQILRFSASFDPKRSRII